MKNLKFKVALIGIISLFVLSISLNEQLVIADEEVSDQDTSVPTEEPTPPSDGGETTEPPIDGGGNGGGETPQPPVDDGGNTGGGDTGGGNDNWNGGGNNNYTPPVTTPTQPEVPVETEPEPEPEVYVEPETPQPTAEEIALANRLWEINNRMSSRIGTSVNQGEPTEEMLLAVQTVDEDEEVEDSEEAEEVTVEEDDDSEEAEEVAVEEDDDSEEEDEVAVEEDEDLVFGNSDEESTDDEAGTSEDTPAEDNSKAELTQTDDSNEVEDQEESAVDTFTDILPTTTETYRPFILMAIGVGATLLFLAVSYLLLRRRSY